MSPSTPLALPGPGVEEDTALLRRSDDRLDHPRRARERRPGLAIGDQLDPDQQAATADSPTAGWSPKAAVASASSRSPFIALASTSDSSSRMRSTSRATAAPTAPCE